MSTASTTFLTVVMLASTSSVAAQSINIDFHNASGTPSSGYAAGGLAGVWNPLIVAQGLPQSLVGLNGEPVAATLTQVGATGAVSTPFQTTVGDDSALLRDYIFSPGPMITIDIVGLLPGDYQVLTYALGRQDFPHSSDIWVNDDLSTMQTISGIWQGMVLAGSSHALHNVRVADGHLRIQLDNDDDPIVNGLQLVAVPGPGAACAALCVLGVVRRRR